MALKCSSAVKQKLAEKHGVSLEEVQQCFANREGGFHLQEWRHTAENLLWPEPKRRSHLRQVRILIETSRRA